MVYFFSSNTSICIRYPGLFCFSPQVNAALCIQRGDANCFSFLISATEICSCFLKLNRQKPQKQPGSHKDTFTYYSGVWKEVVESTGLPQCSLAACWPPPISTPWCAVHRRFRNLLIFVLCDREHPFLNGTVETQQHWAVPTEFQSKPGSCSPVTKKSSSAGLNTACHYLNWNTVWK